MRILLTGGAGFIGSHTAVALIEAGHEAVALDDLSNASPEALKRVAKITGSEVPLVVGDCGDADVVRRTLDEHQPDAVVHFAGLKAVGESVEQPLRYYRTNLGSAITLLEEMATAGPHKLVFSSSATVYEQPGEMLGEDAPVGVNLANPYGRTKAMLEWVIKDAAKADERLEATILRYFNPIGAHPSGLMGEDPKGIPNNLMPYIAQVASGQREFLRVWGNDYDTVDGTGVRDYIHVMDLARAHVVALEQLQPGVRVFNIGTGEGASVLQALKAFSKAVGRDLPYEVMDRRPGDAAVTTADPALANEVLGWHAELTLEDACRDAWAWQSANPKGYNA